MRKRMPTMSSGNQIQAQKIQAKYAPLVGIDQFGDGSATEELQYWNYGLWEGGIDDPKVASHTLAKNLIGRLPSAPARILDVAFGQGESLRELCEAYGTSNVVGVNIAADQVEHARRSGIECELKVMDAARLAFDAESFDGILCIEAAFHFSSRADFLKRAYRILKPGGRLVVSDFLMRSGVGLDPEIFPTVNYTNSIDEYKCVFENAGFSVNQLNVELTTSVQLVPFMARMAEFAGYLPSPDPEVIRLGEPNSQNTILFILTRLLNISETVIVVANRD